MSGRELWLGVASATGLVVLLLGDGVVDAWGFLIAVAPPAYAACAVLMRWYRP